ncbi:RimJ/RimL family protein N-acetyltransferase [Mesorhizobium sp. URHB0026]
MPSMKTVPRLTTPRLVLRAPGERDIPAWFARASDVESAFLAGDPVADDLSAGARWLALARQRLVDGRAIKWSIDQAGVSDAIGTITLSFGANEAKTAALGFVLGRTHWGQGLGSEAAREVVRYALRGPGARSGDGRSGGAQCRVVADPGEARLHTCRELHRWVRRRALRAFRARRGRRIVGLPGDFTLEAGRQLAGLIRHRSNPCRSSQSQVVAALSASPRAGSCRSAIRRTDA